MRQGVKVKRQEEVRGERRTMRQEAGGAEAKRGKKQEARAMRQEARSTSNVNAVSFVSGLPRNFEKDKLSCKWKRQEARSRGKGQRGRGKKR